MENRSSKDIFRNRIRLRHLSCFVAVAQTQHLGRAADLLGLTQPAVSKTLNELEELVGTRLLVRQRAGTELTHAGSRFLSHALRVLADVDAAGDSITGQVIESAECIRLGALPSMVPAVLIDALQAFRSESAEVGVAVHTSMNRNLIDLLKADALDLVIGRMDDTAAMEGLWFESIGQDPLALVVRKGHALTTSTRTTLHECLTWPLVIPAKSTIPRHNAESFLARHGMQLPGGCIETADAYLGRMLVEQSDSVWISSSSAAKRGVAQGTLVVLDVGTHGTEEPVGLLRHRDRMLTPEGEHLANCIRAAARRLWP